jgi:hypothetical protein
VSREIPSRTAARVMFQAVWRSASRMCSRSTDPTASSRAEVAPAVGPGAAAAGAGADAASPSSSAVTARASVHSAARSMTLTSSRTLPGQGWAASAARASAVSVLSGSP